MTEQEWSEYQRRSRGWSIRMGFDLLHSEAYKKLNYAPAIKALNWFYEKIKVEVNRRRRGKDRYQIINGDISFAYREAILRGLSSQQFSKALKELHRLGFIEITKPGSAPKGDFTEFALSERWREFGTSNFKCSEFPQSIHWINFGFGAKPKRYKKKLDMRIHTQKSQISRLFRYEISHFSY